MSPALLLPCSSAPRPSTSPCASAVEGECRQGVLTMNIASLLVRAARVMPERTAVFVGTAPEATYGELAVRASALGSSLQRQLALAPGERVALVMSNCGAYLQCMFACWQAELVCVPVEREASRARNRVHSREFRRARCAGDTGPCYDVVRRAWFHVDAAARSRRPSTRRSSQRCVPATLVPQYLPSPTIPAWLFYTSGTTGRPKGATLTHRNLLAMSTSYLADVDMVTHADCIIHAAPMSHGSGIYAVPYTMAMASHVVPESGRFIRRRYVTS